MREGERVEVEEQEEVRACGYGKDMVQMFSKVKLQGDTDAVRVSVTICRLPLYMGERKEYGMGPWGKARKVTGILVMVQRRRDTLIR